MTGFCGFFVRAAEGCGLPRDDMAPLKAAAKRSLSRNARHVVETYDDGALFLAAFENGAWQANGALRRSNEGVGVVSGNPLVPGEDGVSNDPDTSARTVMDALSSGGFTALTRTVGGFAAVHWSHEARVLRLCADRVRQRPIYVHLTPKLCRFATSLRALRQLVAEPLRVCEQGLAEIIFFGRCLGERTIFHDVELVPPGSVLEVSGSQFRTVRYFDWSGLPVADEPEESVSRRLYALFKQAIARRLRRQTEADAFLSGGLDTRCVIAGLLEAGSRVRAFSYAYPNSADDVLSRLAAQRLGVEHIVAHARPADRLKINTDLYALYAKRHFPYTDGQNGKAARVIWSGDWGSFILGGGTGETESGAAAARSLDEATLYRLFPSLRTFPTRTVRKSARRRLRELAFAGLKAAMQALDPQRADRRLFHFYMLHDQSRVLYDHYEHIDLSDIELETPFYDMDFVSAVLSSHTDLFVGHRLYYKWITHFQAPVADVPWQAYPGHIPCPLPMPAGALNQWETDWYGGRVGAQVADEALRRVLKSRDAAFWRYGDRGFLSLLYLANRAGLHRYAYEGDYARRLFEEITGESIFPLP